MYKKNFIWPAEKKIIVEDFRKLANCYSKLVAAFEDAYDLGKAQNNFALVKLVTDANVTFIELQQAASDLEDALLSLPEPIIEKTAGTDF